MSSRINSHFIEEKGVDIFKNLITDYKGIDIMFTPKIGREYGIDGEVELFDNGNITGKLAKVQVKSTNENIDKLVRSDEVSCHKISFPNYAYAKCNTFLIILVYVSIPENRFYYLKMNGIDLDEQVKKNKSRELTIRIPYKNNSKDNIEGLFTIIDEYYKSN